MLKFEDFTEAKKFVYSLRNQEVETTGSWSYYQILRHLADSMEFSVFGGQPEFAFPFFLQITFGRLLLMKFFSQGHMDLGLPNPVKKNDTILGDFHEEYSRLVESMELFDASMNFHVRHPVFGDLSTEEWRKLQTIHFAHHLSFVKVKTLSIGEGL